MKTPAEIFHSYPAEKKYDEVVLRVEMVNTPEGPRPCKVLKPIFDQKDMDCWRVVTRRARNRGSRYES